MADFKSDKLIFILSQLERNFSNDSFSIYSLVYTVPSLCLPIVKQTHIFSFTFEYILNILLQTTDSSFERTFQNCTQITQNDIPPHKCRNNEIPKTTEHNTMIHEYTQKFGNIFWQSIHNFWWYWKKFWTRIHVGYEAHNTVSEPN